MEPQSSHLEHGKAWYLLMSVSACQGSSEVFPKIGAYFYEPGLGRNLSVKSKGRHAAFEPAPPPGREDYK